MCVCPSLRTGQDATSSRDSWVAQTGKPAAGWLLAPRCWLLKAYERHVPFSVWCAVWYCVKQYSTAKGGGVLPSWPAALGRC